jgi:hypothetical protein
MRYAKLIITELTAFARLVMTAMPTKFANPLENHQSPNVQLTMNVPSIWHVLDKSAEILVSPNNVDQGPFARSIITELFAFVLSL